MPSLLLHAADPCWAPREQTEVVRVLTGLGLSGAACGGGDDDVYLAGPAFLDLVMFLGCSPSVVLDPTEAVAGQPVCRLRLHHHNGVKFLSAAPGPAVRCPHCRTPARVHGNAAHDSLHVCSHCGRSTAASGLDWRRGAGYGRFFLEISGIYPHEAVPSDKLLETLRDYAGTRWHYFYR